MANPVIVTCEVDAWKKVATNVTAGQIHKMISKPNVYLHTYRMTGGDEPDDKSEGVPIFTNGLISEEIAASSAIDVYIYCQNNEGQVRVDIP